MALIRSFFAFPLGLAERRYLAAFCRKQLAPRLPGVTLRWIPSRNYHLTVIFMGSVAQQDVEPLRQLAAQALAGEGPRSLLLDRASWFPRRHQPRMLALETGAVQRIEGLYQKLHQALTAAGYELEQRPYRPHVTLARLKRPPPADLVRPPLPEPSLELPIDELVFYRSDQGREGSVYRAVFRLPLGV